MREITTKVYQFNELSDDAKEVARDWWREGGLNYDWWEGVYDMASEAGVVLGINMGNISFSGFWSQGDGACFDGWYEYGRGWKDLLRGVAPANGVLREIGDRLQLVQGRHFYKVEATIGHSGHYSHEYSMDVVVTNDGQDMEPGVDGEEITECLRMFARWIYSALEQEYEFLDSAEMIDETISCNEYEFLESGSPA